MAEILLCVKDRGVTGSPVWDNRAPKPGDVIAVVEDGWQWGSLESGGHAWGDIAHHVARHKNPHGLATGQRYYIDEETQAARPIDHHRHGNHAFFRIVKLPNCTMSQLEVLMSPEVNVDSRRPSPYLQFRSHFIDKGKFPAGSAKEFHAHWHDDQRRAQHLTLAWTWDEVRAVIGQRPPVPF